MAEKNGKKGEGAPVPTKTKTASIVKQGQTKGTKYGQDWSKKAKG